MDLIEKLRSAAKGGHYPRRLATEAADEIERLQKLVSLLRSNGCPVCHGDCAGANPPVLHCPMKE